MSDDPQLDLFAPGPRQPAAVARVLARAEFDGPAYEPEADRERLRGQIARVYSALRRGQWLTLDELGARTGDPVASVSAQIRHLRKPRHGSHEIDKRRRGGETSGLYEYRLADGAR